MVDAPSEARELLLVDPSDGSDLLFEVLSSTVEDPREGTGIVSVLRNITDLRRATEQPTRVASITIPTSRSPRSVQLKRETQQLYRSRGSCRLFHYG